MKDEGLIGRVEAWATLIERRAPDGDDRVLVDADTADQHAADLRQLLASLSQAERERDELREGLRDEREAVAQIIDPHNWNLLAGVLFQKWGYTPGPSMRADLDASLAKADAILALLSRSRGGGQEDQGSSRAMSGGTMPVPASKSDSAEGH